MKIEQLEKSHVSKQNDSASHIMVAEAHQLAGDCKQPKFSQPSIDSNLPNMTIADDLNHKVEKSPTSGTVDAQKDVPKNQLSDSIVLNPSGYDLSKDSGKTVAKPDAWRNGELQGDLGSAAKPYRLNGSQLSGEAHSSMTRH